MVRRVNSSSVLDHSDGENCAAIAGSVVARDFAVDAAGGTQSTLYNAERRMRVVTLPTSKRVTKSYL
jgi:hypothetical protein